MTVRKLKNSDGMPLLVAEHPTQISSSDRLCFTMGAMWVAYISEANNLVLAKYPEFAIVGELGAPISTTKIAEKVERWCNPTLIAVNDTQLCLIYEKPGVNKGCKSLVAVLISTLGGISIGETQIITNNSNTIIQYDWYKGSKLHIIASDYSGVAHDCPTISHIYMDLSGGVTFTQGQTFTLNTYEMVMGLSFACGFDGIATHIMYSTIIGASKSSIYRHLFDESQEFPIAPTEIIVDPNSNISLGAVNDISAISLNGETICIISGFIKKNSIYPQLFYLHGATSPQPIQFDSLESATNLHLLHGSENGQVYLFFITQVISSHPRSLFFCKMTNPTQEVPNLEEMDFRKPYGMDVLGLAFGEYLAPIQALSNRIISGTLLLAKQGLPNSLLCYYDPLDSGITVSINNSMLSNQRRGVSINYTPVITNPDGYPLHYQWTSPSSLVTFSSPRASSTDVVFDYATPNTGVEIHLEVRLGSSFIPVPGSLTRLTVLMETHSTPVVTVTDATTAWGTPIDIPFIVDHVAGYEIISDDSDIIIVPPDMLIENISKVPISSTKTRVIVTLKPLHTNVDGERITVRATMKDVIASRTVIFSVNVSPFPTSILGDTNLMLLQYRGSLKTANNGLGYDNKCYTNLPSDFMDIKRCLLNSYWAFMGSHAVLWLKDWVTQQHTYLVSYEPILHSNINHGGYTAILAVDRLHIYYPVDSLTPVNASVPSATPSRTSGLPNLFIYQDVPSKTYLMDSNGLKVFGTASNNCWIVLTQESIQIVDTHTDHTEVIEMSDLGVSQTSKLVSASPYKVQGPRDGCILVVAKSIVHINPNDTNYTCIVIDLATRSTVKVWHGGVLPSNDILTSLLAQINN